MALTAATITRITPEPAWSWSSVSWLYAIQAINLTLPLVSLPVATRVLGPDGWAKVAVAQSFGLILGLFVEFGFNYSGVRDLTRRELGERDRHNLTRDILGAQLALMAATVSTALLARPWLPIELRDEGLFWGSILWMIPQSAGLQWYFQATGGLAWYSGLTALSRVLALALLVATVRSPDDAGRAMLVQAAAGLLVTGPLWVRVVYLSREGRVSWRGMMRAITNGRALFAYRTGVYLYAVVNTFALGLLGAGSQPGAYALAERIAKSMTGLLDPLAMTLFPHLVREGPGSGFAVRASRVLCFAGVGISLATWLLCPLLIPFICGFAWQASVDAVRILSLFPLGAALGQAFGIQRLIPAGRDWQVAAVAGAAAICHMAGLWWVASSRGAPSAHLTLAWLAVGVQFFQVALFVALRPKEGEG